MKSHRRPHLLVFTVVALASFFAVGCTEMLTFNLFETLEAPMLPTKAEIAEMEPGELVDLLNDLVVDESFYEEIEPEALVAIVESLVIVYEDPESTAEEIQDAAILAADIELATSGGDEVIETVVEVVLDLIEGGDSGGEATGGEVPGEPAEEPDIFDFVAATLAAAFEEVDEDTEFDATVDALVAAAAAYEALGLSLQDLDGDGAVDSPPGTNMGAIAQEAIVAIFVAETIDAMTRDGLADVAYRGAEVVLAEGRDPTTDNVALSNILVASGMADLLFAGDGE